MHMSGCGRYWFDIYHNPIDDWCVEFIPARRGDIKRIRRAGFACREQAELAVLLLCEEWCVTVEIDCGGS